MDDPFSDLLAAIDIAQKTTEPTDEGADGDSNTSKSTKPTHENRPPPVNGVANSQVESTPVSLDNESASVEIETDHSYQAEQKTKESATNSPDTGKVMDAATEDSVQDDDQHMPSDKGDGPTETHSPNTLDTTHIEQTRQASGDMSADIMHKHSKHSSGETSPQAKYDDKQCSEASSCDEDSRSLSPVKSNCEELGFDEEAMFTIENRPDEEDNESLQIESMPETSPPSEHKSQTPAEVDSNKKSEVVTQESPAVDATKEKSPIRLTDSPKSVHQSKGQLEIIEPKSNESMILSDNEFQDNMEKDACENDCADKMRDNESQDLSVHSPTSSHCKDEDHVVDVIDSANNNSNENELNLVIADVTSQPKDQNIAHSSSNDEAENQLMQTSNDSRSCSANSSVDIASNQREKDVEDSIEGSTENSQKDSDLSNTLLPVSASHMEDEISNSSGGSSHVVIEPGREAETISMDLGHESSKLSIHSVRGNAADFHVIENSSPVVPVVIQPQSMAESLADTATRRVELGKRRKANNYGKPASKVQRFSNSVDGGSNLMNQLMYSDNNLRGGVIRPATSVHAPKGRPPVRTIRALAPTYRNVGPRVIQPTVISPQTVIHKSQASIPTILGGMQVPLSMGHQGIANVLQTGTMTSIIAPRMATAVQPGGQQPKMYTLLIPTGTSLPNQTSVLPQTVTINSTGTHAMPLQLSATNIRPTTPNLSLPVTIASAQSAVTQTSMMDPKVNDNWVYHACNLIPNNVPPCPPASLKLKYVKHYACKACRDTFLSSQSLFHHVTRQSVSLEFKCRVCSTIITSYNKCQLHIEHKKHVASGCSSSILTGKCKIMPLPATLMPAVYKEKTKILPEINNKHDESLDADCAGEEDENGPKEATITELPKKQSSDESSQMQKGKLSYQCPECAVTFTSKSGLAKHFVPRSAAKHYTQCNKCLMLLHSACAYKAHMRIHIREGPFVCPECGMEVLGPRKVFLKHIKQKCVHFTRTSSFPCPRCDAGFAVKSQVVSHVVNIHADIYHKCTKCPMAYKSMASFEEHNAKSHAGKAVNRMICKCPLCDTVYNNEKQLEGHISNHLNDSVCKGRSTFKCLGCSFINSKKKNVITHMNRSHSNMIVMKEMCFVCGIESVASDIQIHTYNVHPKEYPLIYKHTGTSLTMVEDDEEEDGGDEPEQETDVSFESDKPKIKEEKMDDTEMDSKQKWECSRCQKTLETAEVYKKHMAKHR